MIMTLRKSWTSCGCAMAALRNLAIGALRMAGRTDITEATRLAEPARFREAWERAASLRLRDGDASVLADYDQQGRIVDGPPEEMTDAAASAYVALTADGVDVLPMAADHALRRELARRIRDDLIRLGHVRPAPARGSPTGPRRAAGT